MPNAIEFFKHLPFCFIKSIIINKSIIGANEIIKFGLTLFANKSECAIARALIADTELLLCDEPTGALDSENSIKIMDEIAKIHRTGKTIIIVTHDDEVAHRCDRIIRITDGCIL